MKKIRKILSIILSLIIISSVIPSASLNVFAATTPGTPSISVETKDTSFTVKWKKVNNVNGYQIQYSTDETFKKYVNTVETTSTSKNITGKKYRKYYIRVRSYTKKGKKKTYSKYSNKVNARIGVRPVSYKSCASKEAAITVSVNLPKNITGWQIRYSTTSDFKKYNTQTVNNGKTSYTINKSGDNGSSIKIYYKIRSYKKANASTYYTDWSGVKSASTKAISKVAHSNVKSLNIGYNATNGNYAAFELETGDTVTTGFQIRYGRDSSFSAGTYKTLTVSSPSFKLTNLVGNSTYYFQIRNVRKLVGGTRYGSWYASPYINAFRTVNGKIDAPTITSASVSNANKTITVKWSDASVITDYNNKYYVVQYSEMSNFSVDSTKQVETDELNTVLSGLNYGVTYSIRVKTVYVQNGKTYSSPWSNTSSKRLDNPNKITEAPTITGVNTTKTSATVNWNSVNKATNYTLTYSTSKSMTSATTIDCQTNTSITINGLLADTNYYFVVKANSSANSLSSEVYSAKTQADVMVRPKQSDDWYFYSDEPFLYGYYETEGVYGKQKAEEYLKMIKVAYSEVGITSNMSDLDRYMAIMKWIGLNINYCEDKSSHLWAYDGMKYGLTVCQGFASIFNDLCYFAGVPCYFLRSIALDHAYNAIKIQGYWYMCDPTNSNGFFVYASNQVNSIYGNELDFVFKNPENADCVHANLIVATSTIPIVAKMDDICKTKVWDKLCNPKPVRDTLYNPVMKQKIIDSFYTAAEINTPSRFSYKVDKYSARDVAVYYKPASSNNWVAVS